MNGYVGGPIRRFFPILAARADGQAGVAAQQIRLVNTHARTIRPGRVVVQHGKARPTDGRPPPHVGQFQAD